MEDYFQKIYHVTIKLHCHVMAAKCIRHLINDMEDCFQRAYELVIIFHFCIFAVYLQLQKKM